MSFLGLRVKVLIRLFLMLVLTMDFSLCCRARRKPAWATKAAQACGIRVHRGARVASQKSPILRMDARSFSELSEPGKRTMFTEGSPGWLGAGVVALAPLPVSDPSPRRSPGADPPAGPGASRSPTRCATVPCCSVPQTLPPLAEHPPSSAASWDESLAPSRSDDTAPAYRWIDDSAGWCKRASSAISEGTP